MTHFYLTLPSNSSQQFFPDNTMTEFTTKLPSTIELTNEWEVGLAEIMFPRNWYTISKDSVYAEIDYSGCVIDIPNFTEPYNSVNHIVNLKLRGGYYHSIDELISELNGTGVREFSSASSFKAAGIHPPTFRFDELSKRIFVTVPAGMSIALDPALESMLGFDRRQNPMYNTRAENLTVRAKMTCDLFNRIDALYVYCDLLQFTHVGDIKAPLLRVVNSAGEAGEVITRYYERPRYVPLQKKCFDSIEILIRDDLGEKN